MRHVILGRYTRIGVWGSWLAFWGFQFTLVISISGCGFISGIMSTKLAYEKAYLLPLDLTLGAVPVGLSQSPNLFWEVPAELENDLKMNSRSKATGTEPNTVSYFEGRIVQADGIPVTGWQTSISGTNFAGLSLSKHSEYFYELRAIDTKGNAGSIARSAKWSTQVPKIEVVNLSANEWGIAAFEAKLDTPSLDDIHFTYSTADQSAVAGEDYKAVLNKEVAIPAGETSVKFAVTLHSDSEYFDEGDETFLVSFSSPLTADVMSPTLLTTIKEDERQNVLSANVLKLSLGMNGSCMLLADDASVVCWGMDEFGESQAKRVSALVSGVDDISVGSDHNCAIQNGGVKCWGFNAYGELGVDPNVVSARMEPDYVDGLGAGSGVTRVSVGDSYTCAAVESGGTKRIKCWGNGGAGQRGNGTTVSNAIPTDVSGITQTVSDLSAGDSHACAVVEGLVKCWGAHGGGLEPFIPALIPVEVPGITNAVEVDVGEDSTCARLADGTVQCWGANFFGQLGDGGTVNRYSPAPVVGLSSSVVGLSVGFMHACALLDTGDIQCWGANFFGQLGDGSTENRMTAVNVVGLKGAATSVEVGGSHTCATFIGGGVQCWGYNISGQLGNGSGMLVQRAKDVPNFISSLRHFVPAGMGGIESACGIFDDGAMKCWLVDEGTALGPIPIRDSGVRSFAFSGPLTLFLLETGEVKAFNTILGPETLIDYPGLTADVRSLSSVVQGSHFCALMTDGGIKCGGEDNSSGQLGDGTTSAPAFGVVSVAGLNSKAIDVQVGQYHSCALLDTGEIQCWGLNMMGQLGNDSIGMQSLTPVSVLDLEEKAVQLSLSSNHGCALLESGAVKCWGVLKMPDAITPTAVIYDTPILIQGLDEDEIVSISAGAFSTCVLTAKGGVKCWSAVPSIVGSDLTSYVDELTAIDVPGFEYGVASVYVSETATFVTTWDGQVKFFGIFIASEPLYSSHSATPVSVRFEP